jgi:hypothetical protein
MAEISLGLIHIYSSVTKPDVQNTQYRHMKESCRTSINTDDEINTLSKRKNYIEDKVSVRYEKAQDCEG